MLSGFNTISFFKEHQVGKKKKIFFKLGVSILFYFCSLITSKTKDLWSNLDLRSSWRFSRGFGDFGVRHYEFATFNLLCQGTI